MSEKGSWNSWRQGGAQRRDERHTKTEERPAPRGRKPNRKKWCKGRVGIKHEGIWRAQKPYLISFSGGEPHDLNKGRREFVCQKCNKVLDTWYGRRGILGLLRKKVPRPRIGSTREDGQ